MVRRVGFNLRSTGNVPECGADRFFPAATGAFKRPKADADVATDELNEVLWLTFQTIDAAQGDDRDCECQLSEWGERRESRAEEILVIHETIKSLNDDDDVLELFKSTLPSSSSVQVNQSTAAVADERWMSSVGLPGRTATPCPT